MTTTLNKEANLQILVHSFETARGTARPAKSNELNLPPAVVIRRSHKKSRQGCLQCKTRRVKCAEQKPACSRCVHGGLQCVYRPTLAKQRKAEPTRRQQEDLSIMAFPTMTSDSFNIEDMRFFHHFMTKARPHLPIGNTAVWQREIPQFALQNEYLMYAFLALGSSHLGRLVDSRAYQVQALTYRIKGLAGLRQAMAKQSTHYGDADSMIAAGYSLMQQSAHMEDGLTDWMSLLRMITSTSIGVATSQIHTEFDLRRERHHEYIAPYQHIMPAIDPRILSNGLTALDKLRPNLHGTLAISFHKTLQDYLQEQAASPIQGYRAFGQCFKFWLSLSEPDFATCIDPSNGEFQLLMAYFICMLLLMMAQGVIENHEGFEGSCSRHVLGLMGWVRNAIDATPARLRGRAGFVEGVLDTAVKEIRLQEVEGPLVLQVNAAYEFVRKIKELECNQQVGTRD